MIDNEVFLKIEQLQRDYFSICQSPAFRVGTKWVNFLTAIRRGSLWGFLQKEWIYRKNARFAVPHPPCDFDYGVYPDSSVKMAVYSCITGDYDCLTEPFFSIEGVDYIMFTDNPKLKSEKWQLRPIPNEIAKWNDNILINRYIKMHPNVVGSHYNYALYIDGNICVVSNIRNMINVISSDFGFALHQHVSRDCIYDEVQSCKYVKKGNIKKLEEQVARYHKEQFPAHYGLLEATVILTDLHHAVALEIQDKWWQEFINSESRRDQISLPYVLWKNGIKLSDISTLGCPIQQNPKFRKFDHK